MPPTDFNYSLWLLVVDWLIRIAALVWIPTRTTPGAARSWMLLIAFVPLAGLPLYLLFGHPWLSRQRVERQRAASQVIRAEQAPLADQRWHAPADTPAAEMVPLVERLGDFMPTHGNGVELLDDYDEALRRLVADIDGARERVHLLYYLMFDDAAGTMVADALRRAAARGVQCRLLLDAVGG
ncbi:MAG TPA: PLDc N-terminal domain-containing protein, partial [Luteimonas sp.]|nr:PLDc N-terminal domain-containing protein [Luteimonas sp.]